MPLIFIFTLAILAGAALAVAMRDPGEPPLA